MEYCEGGDLKKDIDHRYYNNEKFSRKELVDILAQLCEGICYLHNKNIIHGLAKKIKKNKRNSCMTIVGTDCYMAPEVIRGQNYGKPVKIII